MRTLRAIVRRDGVYVHTADVIADLDATISLLKKNQDEDPRVTECFQIYRNDLAAAFLDVHPR